MALRLALTTLCAGKLDFLMNGKRFRFVHS
jgi:hypothetical protein